MVMWPEQARKLEEFPRLAEENGRLRARVAGLLAEIQRLKAEADTASRTTVLMVPSAHILAAMNASAAEKEGTVLRASDDPSLEYVLKDGSWVPRG